MLDKGLIFKHFAKLGSVKNSGFSFLIAQIRKCAAEKHQNKSKQTQQSGQVLDQTQFCLQWWEDDAVTANQWLFLTPQQVLLTRANLPFVIVDH